jgi:MFS family permease
MHTLWTSASPVLTYPLYAAEWRLTTTVTTAIFAIYPAVVVGTLLLFGNISNYVGARIPMLLGLAASAIGTVLIASATGVNALFVARVFMGIGVGLSAGPATASLVEFNPNSNVSLATTVNSVAQAAGLTGAMLLGGALVQYAPSPLRFNYWVLVVVIAGIVFASWRLPRASAAQKLRHWRPGAVGVSSKVFPTFVAAATVVATAYMLGAVTLSLGGQIAKHAVGSDNALVNGAAISLFAVSNAILTISAGHIDARRNIVLGTISCVLGLAFLMLAAHGHSFSMFIAASTFTGIAYSLQFRGGLALLVEVVPAEERGATMSAIYLIAYLFQGGAALLLGMLATARGLSTAVYVGSVAIAAFSVIGLLFVLRLRPLSSPVQMRT